MRDVISEVAVIISSYVLILMCNLDVTPFRVAPGYSFAVDCILKKYHVKITPAFNGWQTRIEYVNS